ncbi:sigma-70 family RNA polymerase sigma factor [Chitinophaga horti]|uniref:Sigma-70 family RNA polymerase sigma factor n=1 Tax=Chitinophaga horti TaxID=2920382 RepID=A0ABY6J3E5_9BACT|nr:sigma-70 family RNA polymerase sigma factor [Chitinophaga horti]UYQ94185.1 sigma-70 family RNA polymerase sigma factor [Chitinophaga horti]
MSGETTNTDQDLIARIAAGSEEALGQLFERYWEQLYLSAYRKLADDQLAREVVNDVFMDIWRLRGQRDISNVPAYLGKAVYNRVINKLVGKKDVYFFDILENHGASLYEADQNLLQKDLIAMIGAWITTLPERRREIFIRHYFEHLTTAEIAEKMGISQKTVQNQLSAAVQYLRTHYGHLLPALMLMQSFFPRK